MAKPAASTHGAKQTPDWDTDFRIAHHDKVV
jgi:hypothetical protein